MKKNLLFILFAGFFFSSYSQVTSLLSIKPRLQWPNANGYCGETSIQMCGLYYGNYISQDLCRTVAGGEVLINVNDTAALSAFSLNYSEWDPTVASPQYQNYLVWTKQFLQKKQPVIITVYIQGLSDPDYDHIIPAIGFTGANVNAYTGTDQLTYNSCFDTTSFTRAFSKLYDTRSMNGNGAVYSYCIPEYVNYGVAVTGIKDPSRQTKPVHMVLDSLDEPNITQGASARMMKAWITSDSLTPGQHYALLRYNNYLTVPAAGFNPSNANTSVYFTASAVQMTVKDSFLSNTAVFYRCIPYSPTGIASLHADHASFFTVFPNPCSGTSTVTLPPDAEMLSVKNVLGQVIVERNVQQEETAELNLTVSGIYFVSINVGQEQLVRKLIVR